ncbi:ATP-binding cassette domain-containing protein [Aeromonas hydrophila]|uniref:ATP-binding cassette domain-containing protein n=1 Tax=Aeromonas hydrophila TaxID=644 RepID=UPI000332B20A|nr:ATP-binding cassette domain-containing protein [Aeromonas hydrophila]AGM43493.1 ABC transporter ATP-binding protein [Aeromonas hydrophila ML09-119]AHX32182.1 ABC transporter ATP-binding protein [Aeromonas hydrophila subsp. hydrophila AL09-71]AHX68980.1 ABC transporter ATP-binding protein [Aeromonas hydrophila pc104A]AJE37024.1 ABC transporter ATP-binding protein [Aeromonas hydrophila J-1]AKJ35286.1 ABC transporter ATP-binding protein [Aeromonas hydrophila NJ-35]
MLSTTPLHLYLEENLLLSLPALKIMPGEVLTLMGPSGCGKSSLLAALAGVLPASGPLRLEGDVTLGERRLTHLPPQARRIGMLFQDDLLFDHLTVAENLMFGMSASVKGHRTRREKAVAALAQVDLTSQADKLPGALSGGQKARVSLLRALLAEPEALLLDEPFSRLDKPLRAAFRELVFAQIKALAIPAMLVTHDEDDAPGTILQLTESRF